MKNLRNGIKNVLTEHEDTNGCIMYTKFDLIAQEIETLLISASNESRSINGNEQLKEVNTECGTATANFCANYYNCEGCPFDDLPEC